jgi:hypothetical protein
VCADNDIDYDIDYDTYNFVIDNFVIDTYEHALSV